MFSLDLIVNDYKNYFDLISITKKHFSTDLKTMSNNYVSGINDNREFIVSATPYKISFLLSDKNDRELFVKDIQSFVVNNFQNQLIGLRSDFEEELKNIDFGNVETIFIK